MKKIVAISVAVLLALPLVAGTAQAGKKKKKSKPVQVVEGAISLPAPFAQSVANGTEPFDGCWGGLTRQTTGQSGGAVNGVTGYYFDIDPKSWNKPFKLEPTGGDGTVDLDVFLYYNFPGAEGTSTAVEFQTREEGGEADKVPANTIKAVVCMYGGPEYQGFNSTFTYTAG